MSKKEKQKRLYKSLFTACGIMYIVIAFILIHFLYVKQENPGADNLLDLAINDIFTQPFAIFPLPQGTWTYLGLLALGIIVIVLIMVEMSKNKAHYDSETVQGDAKWLDDLNDYNKKFTEPYGSVSKDGPNNIIMSEDIYLGMDTKKTFRNLNVLVIGGSGSGKSYRLVGPNLLQCNCSYIITDPSGDLFAEYGNFFEYMGYTVKCLNIQHMEKSNHYNPFDYIHSDKDVEVLVTTLIENTTPPEKNGGDPFWEKSEQALLVSIIAYLYHYGLPKEKNFATVMKYLRMAAVDEEGRGGSVNLTQSFGNSELDKKFNAARKQDPNSFAVKQYHTFKQGAGKTLKSILISCSVRLQAFDLIDVENLTSTDDIALEAVGDEKTALFVMIPTGEKTFNFLASMMYSQLFQNLYDYAENTAHFSTLIFDDKNQVVKTFRANDPEEEKEARSDAEKFFDRIKKAKIVRNENMEIDGSQWWEIRTQENELVAHRGSREEAERALRSIKNGRVASNSVQSNHGKRMPIHVRMMLDEFANIGKIPDFPTKVATIRKYEISTTIILQSITQLQMMYEKDWGSLSGNCDTTVYLGGGLDQETFKLISDALGKETRTVMNASYQASGGGSSSFNKEGVELFTPAQLRVMPEDECIVLPKSLSAHKGKKYNTEKHPNRKLELSLPRYYFNAEKAKTTYSEYEKTKRIEENHGNAVSENAAQKSVREDKNLRNKNRSGEYKDNKDKDGKKIVEEIKKIKDEEMPEMLDLSSGNEEEVFEELSELNFQDISDFISISKPADFTETA